MTSSRQLNFAQPTHSWTSQPSKQEHFGRQVASRCLEVFQKALKQALTEREFFSLSVNPSFHTIKSFSGLKFVPPGLHVLTWSLPGSMMRNGLVRFWGAKERVVLDIEGTEGSVDEAELRSLDPQLAPYPFARLEEWKKLTGHITPAIVTRVLGDGRIDGMTQVEGEKDELSAAVEEAKRALRKEGFDPTPTSLSGENSGRKMVFPTFDLKRSWKEGATGDEVTRWSRDKSQLWTKVCSETGGKAGQESANHRALCCAGDVGARFCLNH